MAVAFSAVGTGASSTNAAVSPTLSGSVGDTMILLVIGTTFNAGNNVIATPPGWILLGSSTATSNAGVKLYAYWRVRQSGDSAPSVNTSPTNKGATAVIIAYSGVSSIEAILSGKDDDSADSVVAYLRPTTLGASRLVVNAFGNFTGGTDASTPAAGHTERYDTGFINIGVQFAIDDIAQASAGQPASGNRTYPGDVECGQVAFALVPDAAAGIANKRLVLQQAVNRAATW